MRAIHSRDTLPEIAVRKMLFAHGYRFRCQYKGVPGRPDVALPKYKTLIEIRGCFWHHHGWEWDGRKLVQTGDCAEATTPKSNKRFWNAKFRANVRRDARHEAEWKELGWRLITVWTCELAPAKRDATFRRILRELVTR